MKQSKLDALIAMKYKRSVEKLAFYTDNYTPMRTGILKNTVIKKVDLDVKNYESQFIYQGYGKFIYNRPNLKFRGAPQRGARWVHRAMQLHKGDILK